LANDQSGQLSGKFVQSPGNIEAAAIRKIIANEGSGSFVNSLKKDFDAAVHIQDAKIDSAQLYEKPLQIVLNFGLAKQPGDIIYFDPMFGQGYKQNPFKSAKRLYPVEMPHTIDKGYRLEMDIPDGYITDELPKPLTVKLNERGEGVFEYQVTESGGHISIASRVKITRTYFSPAEYNMLREFFNQVVKKQAEQIVFKKKK